LLDALALVVRELLQLLVLVQRRVGGAEAGVGSRVDALLLAVVEELGTAKCKPLELDPRRGLDLRWVVWVQFNLIDGWGDLGARIGEELLEVLDGEVGDTDVLHATGFGELLHLSPGVLEIPIGVVLLEIVGVR
jgi:hypothetical protein